MKRPTTQNPINKVTQTFQRADGSEARITAAQDAIFGGKPHITVERRGGPDEQWRECSKLPHPDWREMSIDEYTQRGRPEHLQTVTFAELFKTTALLGRDLDQAAEEGLAAYAPGQEPAVRRDAPLAEHVEHYLSVVREELGSDRFENGQCHALALTLQQFFGGDLYAILRHEVDEVGARFSTTYSHMTCEIGSQCYDIGGAEADIRWCARWPDEPDADDLTSEFEYVAIAPNELGAFLEKHRAKPVEQELAARLRAIGRREVQVVIEQPELVASGSRPADPELAEQVGPRLSCPSVIDPWEDGGPGAH